MFLERKTRTREIEVVKGNGRGSTQDKKGTLKTHWTERREGKLNIRLKKNRNKPQDLLESVADECVNKPLLSQLGLELINYHLSLGRAINSLIKHEVKAKWLMCSIFLGLGKHFLLSGWTTHTPTLEYV